MTQRVVDIPSRNERRDALDQAWVPFLAACEIEMVAVPNRHPDPAGYLRRFGIAGVILTGGGNISSSLGTRDGKPARVPDTIQDISPERDVTETALLRASLEEGWPVIGVCRGMQVMNLFHGGTIAPLSGHSGTRHSLSSSAALNGADFGFDEEVNSYHDFGVPRNGLGEGLTVLAESGGWPEAFVNREAKHLGIMWHPERNRPSSVRDVDLFDQFFRVDRKRTRRLKQT